MQARERPWSNECVTETQRLVEARMSDETPPNLVPVLTNCRVVARDGQDVAVVLQFAHSPENLQVGLVSELILAMTSQQAQDLGAKLLAATEAIKLGLAANDEETGQAPA